MWLFTNLYLCVMYQAMYSVCLQEDALSGLITFTSVLSKSFLSEKLW